MKILICILLGYLLGTLSPSALVSKLKRKDLRESGTGNLGATNTMLHFGSALGALVMLLDMAKAVAAVCLARWIAPEAEWLWMAAGAFAVIGHCFPFYLKFKGGKGLAAFAGLVLAYKPALFLFLLISGVTLMFVVNYSFILPFYAASFFAVYVTVLGRGLLITLFAIAVSALIIIMHFGNLVKAINGEDRKIREHVRAKLSGKSNASSNS